MFKRKSGFEWPLIGALILAISILFSRFIFKSELPIPFDVLVGWYYPFNTGGWSGYNPGIPFIGGLHAADVIRQMIPWKQLAHQLIAQGQLPLWNPYNFSGEPLLANPQIFLFSPSNIVFWLVDDFYLAWSWYLISLPVIAISGMYFWFKQIGFSRATALLVGVSFGLSGYMLSWLEWGVVSASWSYLGWLLLGVALVFSNKKVSGSISFGLGLWATITAGYPQVGLYSLLITLAYLVSHLWQARKKLIQELQSKSRSVSILKHGVVGKILIFGVIFVLILVSLSPQLLATYKLYSNSALNTNTSTNLYLRTRIEPIHLVNLIYPDYFGNRVFETYWADHFDQVDYINSIVFVNSVVVVLIFSLLLAAKTKNKNLLGLAGLLSLFSLSVAVSSPVSNLIGQLSLPLISTGVAANSLVILSWSLPVLAGISLEYYLKSKLELRNLLFGFGLVVIVTGLAWSLTPEEYKEVARHSLRVPAMVMILTWLILLVGEKITPIRKSWLVYCLILGLILQQSYWFGSKMLTFAPATYAYPEHPVLDQAQRLAGYDRVTGFWEADLSNNFQTQYRLYSAEGYNPLHLVWYQELAAAAKTQGYNPDIARSDVDIAHESSLGRDRLMAYTSTRYVLAKVTNPEEAWETDPLKYPPENFDLVWQEGMTKIYQFAPVLNRVSLYNQYQVIAEKEDRLDRLYAADFDPFSQLVLEEPIDQELDLEATGSARIVDYQPNRVLINTKVETSSMLLLLTDTFYPGWRVYINNTPAKIYRANHAFRAVVVPEGESEIEFKLDQL